MANSPVTITGMRELQVKLEGLPKLIQDEVKLELEASAVNIVQGAKHDAPIDLGYLQNQISYTSVNEFTFEIVSAALYSPYVEWGTGTRAVVPGDEAEYARQFKRGGGEFFKHSTQHGSRPQPFFFPNFHAEKPKLIERIKKIIENAVK